MLPLDDKYWEKLEALAGEVQASDELAKYLEEEEEELYQQLKDLYEPQIAELYATVAANDPLQLVAMEQALLHDAFEGLYLPKVLGFSVLRGEVTDQYKYNRPQEHFKEVLLAICNSANFEILRKRIGQSIQMGFALSSDIWVSNLMEQISNKRIRHFLNSQRIERFRHLEERKTGYLRYLKQFQAENYLSTEFPENKNDFQVWYPSIKRFLVWRVKSKANNSSIVPHLKALVEKEAFHGMQEHLEVMALYAHFFDMGDKDAKEFAKVFNKIRKGDPDFSEKWFDYLLELRASELDVDSRADARISSILDKSIKDDLTNYYALMDVIHAKGYVHEDTQEAVKVFYYQHDGLSTVNECVRRTIFSYFSRLLNNIEESDYHELFELAKYFGIYMQIFGNQHFNQDLEDLSMAYVDKLMKHFTDKRGKDYQDIKKFVSTTFVDLGFQREKEVIELFKTRRKKKKEGE